MKRQLSDLKKITCGGQWRQGGYRGAPYKKWGSIFLNSYPEGPLQDLEVGAHRVPYLLVCIYYLVFISTP